MVLPIYVIEINNCVKEKINNFEDPSYLAQYKKVLTAEFNNTDFAKYDTLYLFNGNFEIVLINNKMLRANKYIPDGIYYGIFLPTFYADAKFAGNCLDTFIYLCDKIPEFKSFYDDTILDTSTFLNVFDNNLDRYYAL